jgi:hypothetical protein
MNIVVNEELKAYIDPADAGGVRSAGTQHPVRRLPRCAGAVGRRAGGRPQPLRHLPEARPAVPDGAEHALQDDGRCAPVDDRPAPGTAQRVGLPARRAGIAQEGDRGCSGARPWPRRRLARAPPNGPPFDVDELPPATPAPPPAGTAEQPRGHRQGRAPEQQPGGDDREDPEAGRARTGRGGEVGGDLDQRRGRRGQLPAEEQVPPPTPARTSSSRPPSAFANRRRSRAKSRANQARRHRRISPTRCRHCSTAWPNSRPRTRRCASRWPSCGRNSATEPRFSA